MNGPDTRPSLGLSIVDRLLDEERPSVQAFRDGLRRDLEDLLNTEWRVTGWSEDLTELDSSLLNYGIMSLATINLSTEQRRAQVVKEIGDIIRRWEPRLKDMRVSLLPNIDSGDRSLRMRIDAEVIIDASPEAMVFDTVIDPVANSIVLKSARSE